MSHIFLWACSISTTGYAPLISVFSNCYYVKEKCNFVICLGWEMLLGTEDIKVHICMTGCMRIFISFTVDHEEPKGDFITFRLYLWPASFLVYYILSSSKNVRYLFLKFCVYCDGFDVCFERSIIWICPNMTDPNWSLFVDSRPNVIQKLNFESTMCCREMTIKLNCQWETMLIIQWITCRLEYLYGILIKILNLLYVL